MLTQEAKVVFSHQQANPYLPSPKSSGTCRNIGYKVCHQKCGCMMLHSMEGQDELTDRGRTLISKKQFCTHRLSVRLLRRWGLDWLRCGDDISFFLSLVGDGGPVPLLIQKRKRTMSNMNEHIFPHVLQAWKRRSKNETRLSQVLRAQQFTEIISSVLTTTLEDVKDVT